MSLSFLAAAVVLSALGYSPREAARLDYAFPEAGVKIEGAMSFRREKDRQWLKVVPCPEGYPETRRAFMSAAGEICGYVTFREDGAERSFYVHQVGSGGEHKSLEGEFAYDGVVTCGADAIPCRVKPVSPNERVASMAMRGADSRLNDAIFLPEKDVLVQFAAEGKVRIETEEPGRFRVRLSGRDDGDYSVKVTRDYFKRRNMPHYAPINRNRAPHAPTGWMAWNIYFDQATAEDNLKEARAGKKYLQPFGLQYWSIESWQGNSDELPVAGFHNLDLSCHTKKFPQGMKAVADEIRLLGFKPGLWIVPWGTGNKAFYETHKEWFAHEPDGRPLSAWPGKYILDITHPGAYAHVKKMIETYSRDWGYEFFKIDGMGAGPGYPSLKLMRPEIHASLHDPQMKDPVYHWTHMFREAMGEDRYFLACGAAFTAPGLEDCDATRIGGDIVSVHKPVLWENILNQARMTLRRLYGHNIVAWNDPDTLMTGDYLTLEEARVTTTVVGLPGQVMFAGDKLTELPPERMRLIQTDLPVADIHPTYLYPINTLQPIWNLSVKRPYAKWNTVALFNWSEEEKEIGCDFAELGLDADGEYLLYETWMNELLGVKNGRFAMKVPPHAVRLVVVHPYLGRPQFLASDRHITRTVPDASFVVGNIRVRLDLIAEHPETVRFYVPHGWSWDGGNPNGTLDADGRILTVKFVSPRTETVERTIRFGRSSK